MKLPPRLSEKLPAGECALRRLRVRDGSSWVAERRGAEAYLRPWEAVLPGVTSTVGSWDNRQSLPVFALMATALRRQERHGQALAFAIDLDNLFVGMLTVTPITMGAARTGQLGYWVTSRRAGRGIATTAVALATDYCLGAGGMHRVEALVRPENAASRHVLDRLGFTAEGVARQALYVDGGWRDHLRYGLVAGDAPEGLVARWAALRHARPVVPGSEGGSLPSGA